MMPVGGNALAAAGHADGHRHRACISCSGALMAFGIGLYAPSLILLSLLGLDPRARVPDHGERLRVPDADDRLPLHEERAHRPPGRHRHRASAASRRCSSRRSSSRNCRSSGCAGASSWSSSTPRSCCCARPSATARRLPERAVMNRRHFFQSSLAAAVAYALPRPAALRARPGGLAGRGRHRRGQARRYDDRHRAGGARRPQGAAARSACCSRATPATTQARRVLNESIDMHPALVVQPTGVADVQARCDFARERELLLAVKCGGHSPSGKSTCEKGMQIDLSRFRGVRVDPEARRAFVDGGSLLGEVDHEAMALGLVTTCGTVSHTGVGGLTLGGGFGRLARRFGLALDNVKAVDIVTADGAACCHASRRREPRPLLGRPRRRRQLRRRHELRVRTAPDAARGRRGRRRVPASSARASCSNSTANTARPRPRNCRWTSS